MPSLRDKRVWLIASPIVLIAIGIAVHQIAWAVWANRQFEQAQQALNRYDYDEAANALERYLSARPDDVEGLFLAAQTARRRGNNYTDTFRRLRQAEIKGAPKNHVEKELGLLELQNGKLTHLAAWLKFCDTNPTNPETPIVLEATLEGSLKNNQVGVAMDCAEWMLRNFHRTIDQAHGLVWRGRTFWRGGEHSKAIAAFRHAVEIAPDYANGRLWLATALIDYDDQEAAAHIEWLKQRRPNSDAVKLQTARLYRNLARGEEARSLLDAILVADPQNYSAILERGRVALDANRASEAEPWLRRAYAIAPADRNVNVVLAECMRLEGRLEEAKKYSDKVSEIDVAFRKNAEAQTAPR